MSEKSSAAGELNALAGDMQRIVNAYCL